MRLIDPGYPSAAVRLAFVLNREGLGAHCVLTAETSRGTLVLDSRNDSVIHWSDGAYSFEGRERPEGRRDRHDPSLWRFDDPVPPR